MGVVTRVMVERDFRLGLHQCVLLMDQGRAVTTPDIERIEAAYNQGVREHAKMVGLVILGSVETSRDKDVNAASEAMMRRLGPRVPLVALVHPGEDMTATVFRTVIRGINVVTRGTSLRPYKTEADAIREVAAAASGLLGRPMSTRELEDALRELRGPL